MRLPRPAWYAAAPDTQFDRLVTRYRARYGKTPYRLASLGYDSVLLAVRSAKNWPIGRAFPAKGLVDKDGFAGVDGSFRFVHAIFGRDPALALAAEERRNPVLDRSGDQHPRIAETDQAAPFGMPSKAGLERQCAHLVGGAAAGAHANLLIMVERPLASPSLAFKWLRPTSPP